MARPCFEEVGQSMFDYHIFEEQLKGILQQLNYPEEQVLRWETTGEVTTTSRAGKIEHFSHSHQPTQNISGDYFCSRGLYLDTNMDATGWDVYNQTRQIFQKAASATSGKLKGFVVGAFELSTTFFMDRIVMGRLIAVAMGASGKEYAEEEEFRTDYKTHCQKLPLHADVCGHLGAPRLQTSLYAEIWRNVWKKRTSDTCDRYTTPSETLIQRSRSSYTVQARVFEEYPGKTWQKSAMQLVSRCNRLRQS